MQSAEIELKFKVRDIAQLEARILGAGFHLETPRSFEENTLFDTSTRELRASGQILRIRHYGERATVTHKRHPADEDPGTKYKVRIETESIIEDGEALAAIFRALGYAPVFRYEKFRTEYKDPGAASGSLVVDETPIGVFAELEGQPEWIDQMLILLGVHPADCMTESYGKLFLAWKQETGDPAENLTFEEIHQALAVAV